MNNTFHYILITLYLQYKRDITTPRVTQRNTESTYDLFNKKADMKITTITLDINVHIVETKKADLNIHVFIVSLIYDLLVYNKKIKKVVIKVAI